MIENKIKLVCDSSVDLPSKVFEENNIDVLYYNVTIGNQDYRDGIDIDAPKLFKLIDENGCLPKTSAMGPAIFEKVFEKYKNEYSDLIYIGLGSNFSSSFTSAQIAAEDYPYVHVIDSQNLSSGTALLVLKIIKFIKEGKTAKEIVNKINAMVPLVRTQFVVDTLKYLHMGGRCKASAKYIASALHIKPIIAVKNGRMEITKKPIGYKKAIEIMISQLVENKDNVDLDYIMITHPMADNDAVYIKNRLCETFDPSILFETRAGGTVGTHCGPRTIGILYILKAEEKEVLPTNE